jgi:hypothetical protein
MTIGTMNVTLVMTPPTVTSCLTSTSARADPHSKVETQSRDSLEEVRSRGQKDSVASVHGVSIKLRDSTTA